MNRRATDLGILQIEGTLTRHRSTVADRSFKRSCPRSSTSRYTERRRLCAVHQSLLAAAQRTMPASASTTASGSINNGPANKPGDPLANFPNRDERHGAGGPNPKRRGVGRLRPHGCAGDLRGDVSDPFRHLLWIELGEHSLSSSIPSITKGFRLGQNTHYLLGGRQRRFRINEPPGDSVQDGLWNAPGPTAQGRTAVKCCLKEDNPETLEPNTRPADHRKQVRRSVITGKVPARQRPGEHDPIPHPEGQSEVLE